MIKATVRFAIYTFSPKTVTGTFYNTFRIIAYHNSGRSRVWSVSKNVIVTVVFIQ